MDLNFKGSLVHLNMLLGYNMLLPRNEIGVHIIIRGFPKNGR